jgi:hypothetical protein
VKNLVSKFTFKFNLYHYTVETSTRRRASSPGGRENTNAAAGAAAIAAGTAVARRSPYTLPEHVTERARSASPAPRNTSPVMGLTDAGNIGGGENIGDGRGGGGGGGVGVGGSPGRYGGGSKVWFRAESAPPIHPGGDSDRTYEDYYNNNNGGGRGGRGGVGRTPLRDRPTGGGGNVHGDDAYGRGEGGRARSPLSRAPASRSAHRFGGGGLGSRVGGPAIGDDEFYYAPAQDVVGLYSC